MNLICLAFLLAGVYKADMDTFTEKVDRLKKLGDRLVRFNFPMASQELEKDISVLKKAEVDVDGYGLIIHYNKAHYDDYYLESFQIMGKYFPFLPFHLVVKLACKALGEDRLSLVEFIQDERKVYCWSVCKDLDGQVTDKPFLGKAEPCEFEGFAYHYLNPDYLNFYS